MDEKVIRELCGRIRSHGIEPETFDTELEQCGQAIEWAKQSQRWDLLMELADALSYHFAYSHPVLNVAELDKARAFEVMREFWQQGRVFAMQGLMAAREAENRDKELQFLEYLTRLATLLQDFDTALHYIQQQVRLVGPEAKWSVAHELTRLGQQASCPGHLATSSDCFQTSLNTFQELNDKAAMADVLLFLGWNELKQRNLSSARRFFERGIEAGSQSNHLSAVVSSLQGLGEALQLDGEIEQARSTFRKALSIADSLESPSADIMREDLRKVLASLNSDSPPLTP